MTRTHVARMLLAHGPLSMPQFREITGWTQKHAHNTIDALLMTGAVQAVKSPSLRSGMNLYALASKSIATLSSNGTQQKQSGSITDAERPCRG